MKSRISLVAFPATLAAALLLTNCGGSDTNEPAGGAGPGGSAGSAGASTAGGGSGGQATGGGGAAGQATAGGGVGGSGGGQAGSGGASGGGAGGSGGSAAGAGGGGSSNGGSGGGAAGGPPATFETLKDTIRMSCYGGVCHDLPEQTFKLIIDDKLYGVILNHTTKNCGPALTPGDPSKSAIVKLLKASCGGTARMPMGKCFDGEGDENEFCVPSATVTALETWIQNGAPQQ